MQKIIVELSDIRAFDFYSAQDELFSEEIKYWASPYAQEYLFLPEELPIELYGIFVFTWAYDAFLGRFSAYTPYYKDSRNIKYVISFLDYLGDVELKQLLIDSENKISKFNLELLKSYDGGDYRLEEAELISKTIWDPEVESYIKRDCRKEYSLVKQSQSFLHEIKYKFAQSNDWIKKTKGKIDLISNYNERMLASGHIINPISELLSISGERYFSWHPVKFCDYPYNPLELKLVETTKRTVYFVGYRDAIELRAGNTFETINLIMKPERLRFKGLSHLWRYEDSYGWYYDEKAQKILIK